MTRKPTTVLAALLALALAAGACSSDEPESAASTPTSAPTTTEAEPTTTEAEESAAEEPPAQPTFDLQGELPVDTADVNAMIEFIETETGRSFLRPPVIVVQDAETFAAGLVVPEDERAEAEVEAEALAHTYRALGYSDQTGSELFTDIESFLTSPEGIAGYYDPDADELYVPDASSVGIDQFRSVLVHELVHALDGQHADLAGALDELEDEVDVFFDSVFPLRAVIEGRAQSVQNSYNIQEGIRLPLDGPELTVPDAYVLGLALPYGVGAQFIDSVGGAEATWDLFEELPVSSESILFGRTGDDPVVVEAPVADGEVLEEGQLGATGLIVWLAGSTVNPTPELNTAIMAADGWGGDSYVLWATETQSCLRANIVGDSDAELAEIASAFEGWRTAEADVPSDRSVALDGEILTVTACGQIG